MLLPEAHHCVPTWTFSEANLPRGRGSWPWHCAPHLFVPGGPGDPGWLTCLLPSLPPLKCSHWPSHEPVLSPVPWLYSQALSHMGTTVLPQYTYMLPLGEWGGVYVHLKGTMWILYSCMTWGKSLNFYEPHFAHLSKGRNHFKHHSGSKTKGVQTLESS